MSYGTRYDHHFSQSGHCLLSSPLQERYLADNEIVEHIVVSPRDQARNVVFDYHHFRTTRIRPCCGRYTGLCEGGISVFDPLAFQRTSSSLSSPCLRARHAIVPARSSSPAALMSYPRPLILTLTTHLQVGLHLRPHPHHRIAFPGRPSLPTRTQRSPTPSKAEVGNSRRRTLIRPRLRRPWGSCCRRLRTPYTRSSTSSFDRRVL